MTRATKTSFACGRAIIVGSGRLRMVSHSMGSAETWVPEGSRGYAKSMGVGLVKWFARRCAMGGLVVRCTIRRGWWGRGKGGYGQILTICVMIVTERVAGQRAAWCFGAFVVYQDH